jgi:phosphoribosylglycinamide formyltransferase-1
MLASKAANQMVFILVLLIVEGKKYIECSVNNSAKCYLLTEIRAESYNFPWKEEIFTRNNQTDHLVCMLYLHLVFCVADFNRLYISYIFFQSLFRYLLNSNFGLASMKCNIALFASGTGSNALEIIQFSHRTSSHFTVKLLVSNNSNCGAMQYAQMYFIPTLHISGKTHPQAQDYNASLLETLEHCQVDMIALAGYMKKLPQEIIQQFPQRIVNIHPALLPKYGGKGMYGLHVHKAVCEAGDQESGSTIHYVTEEYDEGDIITQERLQLEQNETPETLAERVKHLEHSFYPQTLNNLAQQFLKTQSELSL